MMWRWIKASPQC